MQSIQTVLEASKNGRYDMPTIPFITSLFCFFLFWVFNFALVEKSTDVGQANKSVKNGFSKIEVPAFY